MKTFPKRLRDAISNADSGAQFLIGRVVRLTDDIEISKTGTVSVLTQTGTLFKDVLVTSSSRYSISLPETPKEVEDVGSMVIIGFLEADQHKPFIVCYIRDTQLPVPDLPKNYFEFANDDVRFSLDGYNSSTLEFLGEKPLFDLRMLQEEGSFNFKINGSTTLILGDLDLQVEQMFLNASDVSNYHVTKTEVIEETLKRQVGDTQSEYINTLEQQINTLSQEVDDLKQTVKVYEKIVQKSMLLQMEEKANFSLVGKDINIGSEASPKDAAVLFTKLQQFLQKLCTSLQSLTVTCTGPGSVSSPPLNAADFASLANSISDLKSKFIKID